jgi:hypothetical protein
MVAKEIERENRPDTFESTPPLESLKVSFCIVMAGVDAGTSRATQHNGAMSKSVDELISSELLLSSWKLDMRSGLGQGGE